MTLAVPSHVRGITIAALQHYPLFTQSVQWRRCRHISAASLRFLGRARAWIRRKCGSQFSV
jgi:hypothetical protein